MSPSFSAKSLPATPWSETPEALLQTLVSHKDGLSSEEAKRRQASVGFNQITAKQRLSRLRIIAEQFKSPLILILLVAGIVTLFLQEWINSAVIFATILINTALGYWQENKAETVLESLKSYIRARSRVRRDGQEFEIDASELVPGDVIHLTQGDRIPADGRIFYANNLKVDESILTGESLPVEKTTRKLKAQSPVSDRTNMVHSGTLVVEGVADVLITATGDHTEFGQIASLLTTRERETTPLQKAVSHFAIQMSVLLGVLVSVLFAIGLASGQSAYDMFLVAVAVAVSAVPEGLPIALTIILAIGVERLAKRKGVVRKLIAAESLGATNLILTDKTGTLTQAKMLVTEVIPFSTLSSSKSDLLRDTLLTTDVTVENPHQAPAHWQLIGKPMEAALVRYAADQSLRAPDLRTQFPLLNRLPFNSKQKFSAVLIQEENNTQLHALGAPEILLEHTALSSNEKAALKKDIEQRASQGERLLGLISKSVDSESITQDTFEKNDFTFRGLIALRDPLRPNIKAAIVRIADRGVQTIIVTGDHPGTANHIGRELGIITSDDQIALGTDFAAWSKTERLKHAKHIRVYARLTPEQKLELVQLYRELGKQVAVTGDGVNDAPALHAADVGIAIGSGTEVAKGASDLIILDDNFETIVTAIEEGRLIRENIRKVITYLLSNAFSELVLIGGSLLLSIPIPLNALIILYINFFSDSFPALAFAFETRQETHDQAHPVSNNIFDHKMRFFTFVIGGLSSLALFTAYWLLLKKYQVPLEVTRTIIFSAFASYTLLLAFALRSLNTHIWQYNPFKNTALTAGVAIGLILVTVAVYFPPLQMILGTVSIPVTWFLLAIASLSLFTISGVELGKWIYRKQMD